MPTTLILEASPVTSFKWNHRTSFLTKPPKLSPILYTKPPHSPSYTLKCFFSPNHNHNHNQNTSSSKSPFDVLLDTLSNTLTALRKPAIAAVLMGLLLMYDPNASALAASGGRIGGSSFSSRSSSSSSSSRSYSVPRTSAPTPGFSYSAPYYAPSPFGFGGGGIYVGPAVGVGAGSSLFLIFAGFVAFILVSGFLSERSEGSVLTAAEKMTVLKLQVGLLGMGRTLQRDLNRIAEVADTSTPEGLRFVLTETTLALLRHPDYCISAYSAVDVKRGIEDGEKRFNQLSIEERGKFDEETLVNVNNIKRQSSRSQRANGFSNEYIVKPLVLWWCLVVNMAYFSVVTGHHLLDNYDVLIASYCNICIKNDYRLKAEAPWGQFLCLFANPFAYIPQITILAAAEGEHKLPTINGGKDLKEALQKLGSIPSSKLLAVEVLWTPQNENDTLSERELLEDYPLLRPL
ncbi:hypothetical protein Ahy_B06g081173 isoform B [Arachis hypogaea]|uniref:Myelin-associated oligodendrocyte basic protein n=1 Tax=Arachis hypogaea TaxID=3818 RepID=A0A444YKB4_ARAHY|nr:hypothetical protein Ahy_B06g081173 isoform B [Arachis hypogaea]